MPELPEVETTIKALHKALDQQVITKVEVHNPSLRWPVPCTAIRQALQGKSIQQINRRAKYIILTCETGWVIVHLGMSGSFNISTTKQALAKHEHVVLTTANGCSIRYNDPRRFGCWLWTNTSPEQHPRLIKLGPEPFAAEFNADYLKMQAQKRKASVKAFIMDQQVVVGVGNIYASEALFAAGIHPLSPANKVAHARYQQLVISIQKILKEAIKAGGSSLRDFSHGSGELGYFTNAHLVYDKAGQACSNCGHEIKQKKIAGRSSFYCCQCQRR